MKWLPSDISPQNGRIAVVTGANSGLGYYTSRALALKGAQVIMACRDISKGEEAMHQILHDNPAVDPLVWRLDLADLSSVRDFSDKYKATYDKLDLQINNAGIIKSLIIYEIGSFCQINPG